MAKKFPFDEAVKAAKFLMFTSAMQTYSSGEIGAGQYVFAFMSADDSFLAPEWQCEPGASLEDVSLYEGNKLVYTGKTRNFVASKYCQDYLHRIAHVWKATELTNEMKDAMVKLINPPVPSFEDLIKGASISTSYKGDFSDTVVYDIWKKHTQRGSLIGRIFGSR